MREGKGKPSGAKLRALEREGGVSLGDASGAGGESEVTRRGMRWNGGRGSRGE
jgi:hypothetical protein